MNAGAPTEWLAAGRVCPVDYTYAPSVFDRPADLTTDTLYVVGGIYGNLAALDAVERLTAAECGASRVVFNGDYHWFDAEPEWFASVERRVTRHTALRGNVETEIARPGDIGAGCGCAYPPSVPGDVVARSNEILALLQGAAPAAARGRLAGLPMHLVATVGPLRIGIVHGDAGALAGWRFAHDELDNPKRRTWLGDVHAAAKVDVFASTHTCLAALRDFSFAHGQLTIINNGTAGMPNFSGTRFGLVTRIATAVSPHPRLYGVERGGVHIDAIALPYDHDAFLGRFQKRWPRGTPAYASYHARIMNGPDYRVAQAAGP